MAERTRASNEIGEALLFQERCLFRRDFLTILTALSGNIFRDCSTCRGNLR